MKLLYYILALAIASLLAFEAEWLVFWLYVVVIGFIIVYGNHLEDQFINHN